jgi:hypothetical protein
MPNPLYGQSSISRPEFLRVNLIGPVPGQEVYIPFFLSK